MFIKRKKENNEIFNFQNYKIDKHNLVHNNKNLFWVQKLQGYNLQKKVNRERILPSFRELVRNTYEESKNSSMPYSIHNIKIKRQLNLNEYYTFFEFTGEILKKINPNLYELYSTTYIPYFKDSLYNLTKNNDVFSYYYGVSYGKPNQESELFRDNYFLTTLKNDKERMNVLLTKTKSELKFDDWDTYGWSDDTELNVSMVLQEFFPNNYRLWLNYLNSGEGKSIAKMMLEDPDITLWFEKYLTDNYEKYESDGFLGEKKYQNKMFYNLIKIYEESKRKFLKKVSFYEDMASLQIKEGLNFLKIEPYFVKMYFIHPHEQYLNIPEIEEKFIDATKDSWFLIQYTTSTPIHERSEENLEVNKILWKAPKEGADEFRKTISQMLPYWIWDSCHYYIVFAEREELFVKLEKQLESMKKAYNIWYEIDNNLNYFLPWWRDDRHKFKMFGYELPWKEQEFLVNPKNSFFSYYPKNIIYQKGIYLGVNRDTAYPVFYHPFDTKVIQNKNMFVVWSSGSGKTFMTKLMIERWLQYMKYIVVDHLRNYNRHCEALWWKVIYLYKEKINFLYYDIANGEDWLRTHIDAMEHLFTWIANFSQRENDYFKIFLNQVYNNKEINGRVKLNTIIATAEDYYNKLSKTKDENATVIEQLTIVDAVIKRLESIKVSKMWDFLNSDYVLDLYKIMSDNNYIVFSFEEMENASLFKLFWYYVFSNIKNYVDKSLDTRKKRIMDSWLDQKRFTQTINDKGALPVQVIIDEVWKYAQDDYIGSVLFEFAKAIRNKEWGIISITQEIKDLLQSEKGKPLFTQANSYLILKGLQGEEVDIVFASLASKEEGSVKTDDSDKKFILESGEVGNGIFKFWTLPLQKIKIMGYDYILHLVNIGKLDKKFLIADEERRQGVKAREEKELLPETNNEEKDLDREVEDSFSENE